MIDDRTAHLNLALPHADNPLIDDVARLRSALTELDAAVNARALPADIVAAVNAVLDGTPAALDTLNELAAALGDDANFAATMTTALAGKAATGHAHAIADITGLVSALAAKLDSLPIATASVLGGVKVGSGLGIDAGGVLFASAGGGSAMTLQEIVPPSNGVSSITVPGGYVVGTVLLGYNGSFLSPTDFVATDSSTIGLVGFTAGTMDTFVVVKLSTVTIGALPAGSVTNTQLAAGAAVANLGFTPVSLSGAETLTGAKRGTITTDNDLSFDLNAGNDFKCTPAALGTLTFTNIPAAPAMQTGFILLVNTGGYAISAAATTKISAASLALISAAGTYAMSYFTDGTNVYVNAGATV